MNATTRFALAGLLGAALVYGVSHGLRAEQPAAEAPPKSQNAWTLDEALKELKLNPHDSYLQYVVLQLARREKRLEEITPVVEKLAGRGQEGRAARVDLFGMFAGALAVQEGLQLDTMRGQPGANREGGGVSVTFPEAPSGTASQVGAVSGGAVNAESLTGSLTGGAANALPGTSTSAPQTLLGPPPAAAPCAPPPSPSDSAEPPPMPPADEKVPEATPAPEKKDSGPALPSGWYLQHTPQYIPPSPDSPGAAEPERLPAPAQAAPEPSDQPAAETGIIPAATSNQALTKVSYKPVSETCYKDLVETVVGKDGKPEVRSRKVPYTVCRMVAVTSEVETAPAPKAPDAGADEQVKWEKIPGPIVNVSRLKGPTVKSHPWAKMLAGRDPEVSRLSRCVPHDFYFVEFRSVAKLLDLIDSADQWSTFIYSQSVKDARSQRVAERLQKQIALEAHKLGRPFYDCLIDGIAITGSDLFIREGSDVTLLLNYRQEALGGHGTSRLFKHGMERLLVKAAHSRPDATRTTGKMLGVDYVSVVTPDRAICVYAADPEPGLHVRSNSKVGLRRVLEAIRGRTADGKAVKRLGETAEFKYVRTLMPRGAAEEDGFVYLSDAFIRHMVGPQIKLTELHRLKAYNHLRMIGHAAQLYRTEQGKAPATLAELAEADCCPGKFNEDDLTAPDGGAYALTADGTSGVCARHGTVRFLTPCCEIPVKRVAYEEAAAYKAFVDQYNEYWRTYFDPVAIRVQVQAKRVRMETIMLPLIDNTVYTMLSKVLGGPTESLDTLPVPKRNLFSLNVRPNWEGLFKEVVGEEAEKTRKLLALLNGEPEVMAPLAGALVAGPLSQPVSALPAVLDCTELEKGLQALKQSPVGDLGVSAVRLVTGGLGNQIGLHVYDQGVPFDLNLATFLGQMLGSFNGNNMTGAATNLGVMMYAVPVAACTAPGYISLTVKNEQIVDDFLAQLDKVMPALKGELQGALGPTLGIEGDYYKLTLKGGVTARSFTLRIGPARFRVHCARIGKGLYITNHAPVLEDLQAATEAQAKAGADVDLGPKGHALVRMRPRNWDQALPGFRLSWAENNRQTCLGNLAPLSGIARALHAVPPGQAAPKSVSWDDRRIQDYAARVHGLHHACPDGGRYVVSADGKSVTCTVHGSAQEPRQGMAPADTSPTARLMRDFADLSAALTFTPEGLRAVLMIERK